MAFVLRSTNFIRNLFLLPRQSVLLTRRGKAFFLTKPNVFVNKDIRARNVTKLALKRLKDENYMEEFEKSLYQLAQDVRTRNIFIENIKDVFEIMKEKGEMPQAHLMLLLKCCGEASFISPVSERVQLAEEIWKTAADLGTQFEISDYNALLNVFLENNYKFSPSEFMDKLIKEGLEPNLVTYKRILKAFCQQGDIEGANGVLEKMKTLDHPLSEEDFNALIQCYCKTGDLEKVVDIINLMKEKDIDPTSKSYLHLLCAYAKNGSISKLKAIMKELPEMDIYLSDYHISEIVYQMAVNGHTEHIDEILQKMSNSHDTFVFLDRVIHRLLHDKLDSVALKIFTNFYGNDSDRMARHSEYIMRHFMFYREVNQLLDFCAMLKERDLVKYPESHFLKVCFFEKDEHFTVSLLRAMMDRNMEVRSHYFWPALIKASKNGTSAMLEILKIMPRTLIQNCNQTVRNITLPNFNLGEDWQSDYETFKNLGFKREVLNKAIFERLLAQGRFSDAEKAASTLTFDRRDCLLAVDQLARLLNNHPDQARFFVNVIYYFAHDYNNINSRRAVSYTDEGVEDMSDINLFDFVITRMINNLKNEEVLLRVLELMLEKNMGITNETGKLITSSCNSQEVNDVVEKLMASDLIFETDGNLCKKKASETYIPEDNNVKEVLKKLTSDVEANVKILWPEMERQRSLEYCIALLRQLIMEEKYKEIGKLLEKLSKVEDFNISTSGTMYLSFVYDICKTKEMNWVKSAFDLGLRLGILKKKDMVSVSRYLLQGGNISEAIDWYIEFLEDTKSVLGSRELLTKVIAEGNEEAIKKFTTALGKHVSQQTLTLYLILGFTRNGQLKKAKRIIDTVKFRFTERFFYNHCSLIYNVSTSKVLENHLALVKDQELFDRVPMYKLLLSKYAEEGKLESAKQLWLVIEEDDISDYFFLEKMREFMNNPTHEHLEDLARSLDKMDNLNSPLYSDKKYSARENDLRFNENFEEQRKQISDVDSDMKKVIAELAQKGDVENVVKCLKKFPTGSVKRTAMAFLDGYKFHEFLEFLGHYIREKNYEALRNCFNIGRSFERIQDDQTLFEKYRSYAIECFEKGGCINCINCYFVTCLRSYNTVKEAEEIVSRYPDHFKSLTFSKMDEIAKLFDHIKVCENFISSQKLKSFFPDFVPGVYSKAINKCMSHNPVGAAGLLDLAVADGVINQIPIETIQKLAEKLEEEGKSFPHPELLRSKS